MEWLFINTYIIYVCLALNFIFAAADQNKRYIFNVQTPEKTVQFLLNHSETFDPFIRQRLQIWKEKLSNNSLLFDNVITNFLYIKMLRSNICPFNKKLCRSLQKQNNFPGLADLEKSVLVLKEMMEMYQLSVADIVQEVGENENMFMVSEYLLMAEQLFDGGFINSAQNWLEMAEKQSRIEHISQNTALRITDLKREIKMSMKSKAEDVKFFHLCQNTKTTFKLDNFCKLKKDDNNPFTAFKVEILSQEPVVELVYDFLRREDIDELLKISLQPHYEFYDAPVSGESDDDEEPSYARIAMSVFLDETLDPGVTKIKRKLQGVSGVNFEHSEDLEIIKYRPGGVHQPHVDNYETEEEVRKEGPIYGNRFAQALIFLSNVELGGSFVMPLLDIVIVPDPGSLVVWYNTDNDGNMDRRSLHGGCPVYKGNKIAAQTCTPWLAQKYVQCKIK